MSRETPWTAGPWHVGAQNDLLYVTAGREPASNNDHPWHDAPRVAVARIFFPGDDDCLPIDALANARLIAAGPTMAHYIGKRAAAGDPEAKAIWEAINGYA